VASVLLAAAVAGTAIWSYVLLDRTPGWNPWLRIMIMVVGVAAGILLLVAGRLPRRVALYVAAAGLVAALLGPVAYSVATTATPTSGAIPSAGPAGAAGVGGLPRLGGPGGPGGLMIIGGPGGSITRVPGGVGGGTAPNTVMPPPNRPGPVMGRAGGPGGNGGLLNASDPSDELVALLTTDASSYTWVAATVGANNAAGVQLATGEPVMAIGGFNGSDPSPALEQFQTYVAEGQIHYFLGAGTGGPGGGGPAMGGPGGGNTASEISAWVTANFTATTVGGTTVYDLTT
jgi:4-amino-4-deoxy-L-arabinose transferase-like glycosyltransferase